MFFQMATIVAQDLLKLLSKTAEIMAAINQRLAVKTLLVQQKSPEG
jgi:hypothetical protein